jgi:3-deoxy-manno-octulosonate cytidylyltransferase (CMP-KDO synthetase)
MNAIAIIPARYGSTRLPGKPLLSLAGRPLILHVLDRAKQIKSMSRIIVATDDDRIINAVRENDGEAIMTPKELASGSDRVGWVARNIDCDIVVNLQGDEPLIDTIAIDRAIMVLKDDPNQMVATLGYPIKKESMWKNINVVKVIVDRNFDALYFSRQPIPFFRDGKFKILPRLYQHLGVYIFRKKFLLEYLEWEPSLFEQTEKLEQLRIIDRGYKIKVIETDSPSFGVDTSEDLNRVEQMLKQKGYKIGQKNS